MMIETARELIEQCLLDNLPRKPERIMAVLRVVEKEHGVNAVNYLLDQYETAARLTRKMLGTLRAVS